MHAQRIRVSSRGLVRRTKASRLFAPWCPQERESPSNYLKIRELLAAASTIACRRPFTSRPGLGPAADSHHGHRTSVLSRHDETVPRSRQPAKPTPVPGNGKVRIACEILELKREDRLSQRLCIALSARWPTPITRRRRSRPGAALLSLGMDVRQHYHPPGVSSSTR